MNNLTITGNLTETPEIKFGQNGGAIAKFTIADNENRRKPDGTWEQVGVTWWRCTMFGKTAEAVADLTKGTQVIAIGRVKTHTWQTDTGEKRSAIEVIVQTLGSVPREQRQPTGDPWGGAANASSDEAPF